MQVFFLSRVLGMMCDRKIGPHETGEFCHTERTEHEQEEINRRAKYWIPKGGRIWSSGSNVRTSTVRKSQAVMGAQCAISILTLRHLPLAALAQSPALSRFPGSFVVRPIVPQRPQHVPKPRVAHLGLSTTIDTTRALSSSAVRGRRGRRRFEPSYFSTNWRYQLAKPPSSNELTASRDLNAVAWETLC